MSAKPCEGRLSKEACETEAFPDNQICFWEDDKDDGKCQGYNIKSEKKKMGFTK